MQIMQISISSVHLKTPPAKTTCIFTLLLAEPSQSVSALSRTEVVVLASEVID
jgi:hypothetical protein